MQCGLLFDYGLCVDVNFSLLQVLSSHHKYPHLTRQSMLPERSQPRIRRRTCHVRLILKQSSVPRRAVCRRWFPDVPLYQLTSLVSSWSPNFPPKISDPVHAQYEYILSPVFASPCTVLADPAPRLDHLDRLRMTGPTCPRKDSSRMSVGSICRHNPSLYFLRRGKHGRAGVAVGPLAYIQCKFPPSLSFPPQGSHIVLVGSLSPLPHPPRRGVQR